MELTASTSIALPGLTLLTVVGALFAQEAVCEDPLKVPIAAVLARADVETDGVLNQTGAGEMCARISSADANRDGKIAGTELFGARSQRTSGR